MLGAACLLIVPMLVHTSQRGQPASLAWQASGGPMGGVVTNLIESGAGALLARVDEVLYRSTDDGRSWRRCRDLPPRPAPQSPYDGPSWLWSRIADRERGAPRPDSSATFLVVTDGRCETFGTVQVPGWSGNPYDALSFVGGSQYRVAVTAGKAFRTRDNGRTWEETFAFRGGVTCAAIRRPDLLVLAGSTLYQSNDDAVTWSVTPEDPDAARSGSARAGQSPRLACPFIHSINTSAVYATGADGVWRSRPLDIPEWSRVHTARPELIAATERRVWMQMDAAKGKVLLRSEDEGASWTTIPFPLAQAHKVQGLLDTSRGTLLAGTSAGIFRSTDKGHAWTLTGVLPEKLKVSASALLTYASDSSGLWVTRDAGASWHRAQATIDGRSWTPNDQLSRMFDVGRYTAAVVNEQLFRVTAGGVGFVRTGLDHYVESIVHVDGTYYAATSDGVFRSRDFSTWVECSLGLKGESTAGPLLVVGRGDLLLGGAAISTDGCRSWWPLDPNYSRRNSDFMFGRPREVIAMGRGIARLDLETRVWSDIKDGTEIEVTSAALDARGRYWMGTEQGVYVLMPDQHGWEVFPVGLQHEPVIGIAVDRGYLIAAVRHRGLFRAALP